mgnify:CR=1 FL=1
MTLRHRFDVIEEAAIDASSMIYMLKSGFLGLLGSTITLVSIPPVIAETGWNELPVTVNEGPEVPKEASNDERLLAFAVGRRLPLISEDRALLTGAEEAGLDYYNSLMMLALLRYRERLDDSWFREARGRLLGIARYGSEVIKRFDDHCEELGIEI